MIHGRRARDTSSGLLCCHRAAYSNITPQACLERNAVRGELCGSCSNHTVAMSRMVDSVPGGLTVIQSLASEQRLTKFGDPHVDGSDRNHEGRPGEQKMNTFIVWINGIRMPPSFCAIEIKGRMSNMAVLVTVKKADMRSKILTMLSIDQYIGGKLQARYEWVRPTKFDEGDGDSIQLALKPMADQPRIE